MYGFNFHFFNFPNAVREEHTCKIKCFPCRPHTTAVEDIRNTEIYCTVIVGAWNSQPLPWRYTRAHISPHADHYRCEVGRPTAQTQNSLSTEDTEDMNIYLHMDRKRSHGTGDWIYSCRCWFTLICLWIHTCVRAVSERGRESKRVIDRGNILTMLSLWNHFRLTAGTKRGKAEGVDRWVAPNEDPWYKSWRTYKKKRT